MSVASATTSPTAVARRRPRITSRISRYSTIPRTTRMTRLISLWSGVSTRRNVRAPAVIRFARLAPWTFSAT